LLLHNSLIWQIRSPKSSAFCALFMQSTGKSSGLVSCPHSATPNENRDSSV
jgi:hypothetical protein